MSLMVVNPYALASTVAGVVVRGTSLAVPAGNVTSVNVPWAAGAASGDRVVIFASHAFAVNTPTGWTTHTQQDGTQINGEVMSKVLDAADITATSVSVTFTGSFNSTAVAMVNCVGAPAVISSVGVRSPTAGTGVTRTLASCAIGDMLFWFMGQRSGVLGTIDRGTTLHSGSGGLGNGQIKSETLVGASGSIAAAFTWTNAAYSAGICLRA